MSRGVSGEGVFDHLRSSSLFSVPGRRPKQTRYVVETPGRCGTGCGKLRGPSVSEAPSPLIEDRTTSTRKGSLLLDHCDRKGFVELFTKEGRSVILPTTCNTWGCVVCRKKLMAIFEARVELGCLRLGRCAFITITYLKGSERLQSARCVPKDWAALWLRLKRQGRKWQWLKVTELTKAGTPHHHLTIGPIEGTSEVACHRRRIQRGRETAEYVDRMRWCECVAHVFSRAWWAITGDSFMVHGLEVDPGKRAGTYMAKYMHKTFEREWVKRRYSTSRGWPAGGRMRLRATAEHRWDYIRMWPPDRFPKYGELNPEEGDLLERVGEDVVAALERRWRNKAARREFDQIMRRHSVRPEG